MSASATSDLIPTRKSLLSRLRHWDDHESWKTFFDTYWRLIYTTAIKAGLSEEDAQDVVQEVVLEAAKKLPRFHYDPAKGSFKNWLMQLTRWRIVDQLRKRQKLVRRPRPPAGTFTGTDPIEQYPDPSAGMEAIEGIWDVQWEQNLAEVALARVKQQVDARQYQIFDCYVIKQWSASRVAQALQVSSSSVYLAKHRIGRLLKKEMNRLRKQPI